MKFCRLKILLVFSLCFLKIEATFLSKIPQKYISDSNFISMTLKTQNPESKLYASPKGSGSSCSSSSPCSLSTAVEKLKAGCTLYLKGGEYNVGAGISIEKSGSSGKYIVITSVKGETPIITSISKNSEIPLFTIESKVSYIIVENLSFKNVKANHVYGIAFYEGGQNHIIIRNNEFTSLKATATSKKYDTSAILLLGESSSVINNVMIYHNKITNNVLSYGEAVSIMGNCENIYVLNNTLTNNDNIGIDFNGNTGDCKSSSLDQPRKSVAMFNRVEKSKSSYDECAGIYADGARDIYIYQNTVLNSDYGIEVGAENNDNKNAVTNIVVENNKLIGNVETGIRVGGYSKDALVVKNSFLRNNQISKSKKSIIISKSNGITIAGNQMSDATRFIEMEEEFTNSINNIIIQKNTFSGTGDFLINGKIMKLQEFIKQYNTNTIKN